MGEWFSESLRALLALLESTLRLVGDLLTHEGWEDGARLRQRQVRRRLEAKLRSAEAVARALKQLSRVAALGRPSPVEQPLSAKQKGEDHGRGN